MENLIGANIVTTEGDIIGTIISADNDRILATLPQLGRNRWEWDFKRIDVNKFIRNRTLPAPRLLQTYITDAGYSTKYCIYVENPK